MTDKPSIESLLACVDALYRYEALSYNKAQDFRDALSELESLRAENEALRDKVALQERQFSEYVERSTDDQIHRLAALKQWIAASVRHVHQLHLLWPSLWAARHHGAHGARFPQQDDG